MKKACRYQPIENALYGAFFMELSRKFSLYLSERGVPLRDTKQPTITIYPISEACNELRFGAKERRGTTPANQSTKQRCENRITTGSKTKNN